MNHFEKQRKDLIKQVSNSDRVNRVKTKNASNIFENSSGLKRHKHLKHICDE